MGIKTWFMRFRQIPLESFPWLSTIHHGMLLHAMVFYVMMPPCRYGKSCTTAYFNDERSPVNHATHLFFCSTKMQSNRVDAMLMVVMKKRMAIGWERWKISFLLFAVLESTEASDGGVVMFSLFFIQDWCAKESLWFPQRRFTCRNACFWRMMIPMSDQQKQKELRRALQR